jgi:hypothetical protein
MHAELGAALANPSLLSPSLSCSTHALPADLANSGAARVGSRRRWATSLFGGNSARGRSRLWSRRSARASSRPPSRRSATPCRSSRSCPPSVDAVQKSYADVSCRDVGDQEARQGAGRGARRCSRRCWTSWRARRAPAPPVPRSISWSASSSVVTKAKESGHALAPRSPPPPPPSRAPPTPSSPFFRSLEFLVMKVTSGLVGAADQVDVSRCTPTTAR